MGTPGIMIAAPASGSGKTSAACGLMAAFGSRGIKVRSCKCGPDYIDPMFHREVLGVDSENLDLFFSKPEELRECFRRHTAGADFTVVEGVMGYYDGMGLDTDHGSSYEVASVLNLPVILVVPCRGAALSLAASVRGMLAFRKESNIRGILLNRVSGMLYPRLKQMLESELKQAGYDIPVVGYMPEDDAFRLESRHLGLITPQEIEGLREQTARAGEILTETADLDLILQIAEKGAASGETAEEDGSETGDRRLKEEDGSETGDRQMKEKTGGGSGENSRDAGDKPVFGTGENRVRIGIARDKAFCFYYKDNLELLEKLGCELVPFSPLSDPRLPDGLSGLIFGGGYPELYGRTLAENKGLLQEIHSLIEDGIPCLAECGGFMYLHEELEDREGQVWKMTGNIKGRTWPVGRLVRFGYVKIMLEEARTEAGYLFPGEEIRGHEFHYWDSTDSGLDCLAVKPDGRRSWQCIHMDGNLFAGYPHLYLPSLPAFAERFVRRCREWG